MSSLKIKNLNRAIDKLSNSEMSLYIYIVQRSDRFGLLKDLSMREACFKIGFSKQSFYNALYKLKNKGFLNLSVSKTVNFDILLVDNKFDEEIKDPYMNLNNNFLDMMDFYKLSFHVKKFILRLISIKDGIKVKMTCETIRKYKVKIEELIDLLTYSINSNGTYIITLNPKLRQKSNNINYLNIKHKLEKILQKRKVCYTSKTLRDTINVISNNKKNLAAISISLDHCLNKNLLQPKLLNKIIQILNKGKYEFIYS